MKDFNAIIERREGLVIVLILALATFLRIFRLGYQGLWIDEINSVIVSGKHIFKIIFFQDTTPPFILLINHFWQKLGNSDFMVRFPAAVFGVASIYTSYKLAKIFFGIKEAMFSSFVVSISLYHIMYSQEAARPYTAFIFFSSLSLYCLHRILNTDQRKYWLGFIIFNILNLYTHLFAIFLLVGEAIIWLTFISLGLFKKGKYYGITIKRILRFCFAVIGILILSLPVSIQFLTAARYELSGGKVVFQLAYYKNLLCRYGAGNGLALFIYNFFFLSGIISLFKGDKRREIFLLIFFLIFPFLVLSFMELKHFFHIRYVIFIYPLYIIIVSKGITNILDLKLLLPFKKAALLLTVIIFLGLSFSPLSLYYQMPARLGDWKGAANYIYSKANNGAYVITNEWHDNLIRYYLKQKPMPDKIKVITHHNNEHLFRDMLSNSQDEELYYVTSGNDEIEYLANKYFSNKLVFFSPVYLELGKRELIDWDETSWFNISENRYRLVVYFNKDKG